MQTTSFCVKRVLVPVVALLLALVVCLAAPVGQPDRYRADAATLTVSELKTSATTLTLNELKTKFPAGRYWNHAANAANNVNGTTNSACGTHVWHADGNYYCDRCNWYYDSASKYSLTQCWGFAFKCGYDAYGTTPGSWKADYDLSTLKAGDIVRYNNGSHVIFVTAVSGNTVTYGDCNSDLHCKIRWEQTTTKANIPMKAKTGDFGKSDHVWHAPSKLKAYTAFKGSQTISDDYYLFESGVGGGQYMNINNYSTQNKANVQTYASTSSNNVFSLTYLDNGSYKIVNRHSGKSLDIPGVNNTVSGKNVQQYTYEGKADQQWTMVPDANGYYYIRNRCDGYALDVTNGKSANGTNIQLYTFDKTKAQKWKMLTASLTNGVVVGDGEYYLRSDVSGHPYLTVKKGNVELTNDKSKAVTFNVKQIKNRRYNITVASSGKAIDVAGTESVYQDSNIVASNVNDADRDQIWIFEVGANGTYQIVNRINGFRMDVNNSKSDDGTNVKCCRSNGKHAQYWHMEKVLPTASLFAEIAQLTDNDDTSASTFGLLRLKAAKCGKKNIRLTWQAIDGADKYIVYGNVCGKTKKYKKLATVTKTKKNVMKIGEKALKKGKYYKFIVIAVRDGNAIATSKSVHAVTTGSKKYTNATGVSLKNVKGNKLTLSQGSTFKISASQLKPSGKKIAKHRGLSFESDMPAVAKVGSKGKITALAKGTANVYVYAQNGKCKKIAVTVS